MKMFHNFGQISDDFKQGIGFWMNYHAYQNMYLAQNSKVDYKSNLDQMFVFKFSSDEISSMYMYIEMFKNEKIINHNLLVQTSIGWQKSVQQMDYHQYEGDWILFYCYMDVLNSLVSIYYYSSALNQQFIQTIQGKIILDPLMIGETGGYRNIKIDNELPLNLQSYSGMILTQFATSENIFDNFGQFILDCPIQIQCLEYTQQLIPYNVYMTGDNIVSEYTPGQLIKDKFLLKGWVKQNPLKYPAKLASLLLRISLKSQYFDNNQIGDRVLYLQYLQNKIQGSQNGFSLQTYSFIFPNIPVSYLSDDSDTILVFCDKYKDLLTQWHYFQFEMGTNTNNGQPIYRVKFPSNNLEEEHFWNKPINHFSNTMFYFHIGGDGDGYTSNPFRGYLSNWSFEYFCSEVSPNFEIVCDYTCFTCSGISSNECLSCLDGSFRIYSPEYHSCTCAFRYIDNPGIPICQELWQYDGVLSVVETEITCDQIGYYQCDINGYICDYGYFSYNNECIKCPHYDENQNQNLIFRCADCYIFPDIFSTSLNCTFLFKSSDSDKTYFTYLQQDLDQDQFEVYKVIHTANTSPELNLLNGMYYSVEVGDYSCKDGYYQDDGQCKSCVEGCKICKEPQGCGECDSNYAFGDEGICVQCKICDQCFYSNGQERCQYRSLCNSLQYWQDYKCQNCGYQCASCDADQCYQCIDIEQYFITLDNFNCAKCSIQHCKYCFQYIDSLNGILQTTLELRVNRIDLSQTEAKIGCALCENNYFFSFLSLQCVPSPQNMLDCDFGLIKDEFGTSICIKSETRLDSIQSSNCNNPNCQSCINNYQQKSVSFCIICLEGYYSSYMNGICKKCPSDCATCAEQHATYKDYLRWNIRTFYEVVINSNGNHPFEQLINEAYLQIACLSCPFGYKLHKTNCYRDCSNDCLDCRIAITERYFECFECTPSIYNLQRSVDHGEKIGNCIVCPDFCSACYPRTPAQIIAVNPFFNQTSDYLKYSHYCYKSHLMTNSAKNIIPGSIAVESCSEFKKCERKLNLDYYFYCDFGHMLFDRDSEPNESLQKKYHEFNHMVYYDDSRQVEAPQVYEYVNKLRISEAIYTFEIRQYFGESNCEVYSGYPFEITSNLQNNVFSISKVILNLQGENLNQNSFMLQYFLENYVHLHFKNFEEINFKNIQFIPTIYQDPIDLIHFQVIMINDYLTLDISFKNCELYSSNSSQKMTCTFTSNRPKSLTIFNMKFTNLNILNSQVFNFQPTLSTLHPTQTINEFHITRSFFSNTSIFYFSAVNNSLSYIIHFTNLSITTSVFNQSFFINSTFFNENDIAEIYFENIYLDDVTFVNNSAFLNLLSIQKLKITNLTLANLKFLDSSSFLISNVMEISKLRILDSIIYSGYFITNFGNYSQSITVREKSKLISLADVVITNNIYSSQNSFLYLVQSEVSNLTFYLNGLILNDNNYALSTKGTYSFDFVSYQQTLLYIDCSECYLNNIQIFRGVGYPEILIINSQQLIIDSLIIQLNSKYYLRSLHSSVECAKKYMYLDIPFVLYIMNFHDVQINNVIVKDSIIIDYSFILLVGRSYMETIQHDSIVITNSIFQNNLLLITRMNRFSSILSIQTEQSTTILINNIIFLNNHLNAYYEDIQLHSSTTLLLDALLGNITIKASEFLQNVLTNSSQATLYIKASQLQIESCNFSNQNILNTDVLVKNLILSIDKTTQWDESIYSKFQILSEGGNGYFFVSQLQIINTSIANSIAVNGAGFYIVTKTEGIISIKNSQFSKTKTLLNGYQLSSGGLFYIDSSKSKFNFSIFNSTIASSYSRTFGGVIFIEPSRLTNFIVFDYVMITSAFSLQHSILSYSPNKLIQAASYIYINNSYFSNNQSEFEQFISQIQDFSLQNVSPFQTKNPAIFTQFSNFTIMNCIFTDMHLVSLIQIDQGDNINLLNLKIFDGSIFQQPIIRLSLREDIIGRIRMENIELINIKEFIYNNSLKCTQQSTLDYSLLCPSDISDINKSPIPNLFSQNLQILTNQKYCNLNSLYNTIDQNFSLIELQLQENHFIDIQSLTITEIVCNICYFGLISVQGFNTSSLNLRYDNIKLINNVCGQMGCFSIIKSPTDDYISIISFENNNTQSNVDNLKETQDVEQFKTRLTNSVFYNNTASYGGACFITNINLLIKNSYFLDNEARVEGGAIYYYSHKSQLLIIDSQIVNNSANIAGGAFLNSNQVQKREELNLFFKHNQAHKFGDNLFETPRKLYLSLNNTKQYNSKITSNSTTIIEKVDIYPYSVMGSDDKTQVLLLPSGISLSKYQYFDSKTNSYLSYNLSLRLLAANAFDEIMIKLDNTQCLVQAQIIDKNINLQGDNIQINGINQYLSITQVPFNETTGDYNLDDLIIYFNPFSEQNLNLQLVFSCNSIKVPYYDSIQTLIETGNVVNYFLLLNLRTFPCQLGEYLNVTSGGCLLCDISSNQYSVTPNSTGCSQKDEVKMKNIEPALIELRETYWRAYYYSQTIEFCYNVPVNCQGGWNPGNPSCALGHLGALCEQCDLYDIKGDGSFSQNYSYSCSSCEQMVGNILNIIFVIGWTLLSIFISVNSTIQMIDNFVVELKLKSFGYFTVAQQCASTSVLLKVFTNYFQIISSISSFQIELPMEIIMTVRSVGNPIESITLSLDCYLIGIIDITIIYFRVLWGFFTAGMYIFLYFSIHLLISLFKKSDLNITFITTTLIYIYIYLSPNLVSQLSALISYRNISDEKWIAANVTYLYETQQHTQWLIYFVTPAFFLVSLLLPFFFWYVVYHHRKQLNSTKVRKRWGYLYNEYKLSTYYWETIKILQKEFIILVMIYYEDYVVIKASLIFFILMLYKRAAIKYQPYLTGDLNTIDQLSTMICQISIILASQIYTAQQYQMQEIIWPFYGILCVINFLFIIQMISKILFAYFDRLHEQIDKLKQFIGYQFPFLKRSNKYCQKCLLNTTERKQAIRKSYQKIRVYLLKQAKSIIALKESNNMHLQNFPKLTTEFIQVQTNPQVECQDTSIELYAQKKQILLKTQLVLDRQN